ncbi:hypothetical protein F6X86_10920 [Enterococcus durans]|uniref:Uncharacterized protein n=1 Tax=Enterococcus durans TaxID=53345 RepID=A0A5N0YP61_9ENTE|nr:hypothetical protein F6X86_10920 [Enterococcus durans]TKN18204.1 hypothetical protein DVW83_06640 [Enterococcus sp. VV15]KAA9183507.1 hypothetical protein F6X85_11220 [Enterococcus durans]KAA9184735.1 hypothetical protein F6X90_11480 [Enterococcus durans]KAA9189450.1 hypothetical protein F6Y12_11080 [Enterococcus durans]
MHENFFSNLCEFRIISEGFVSAPTVYSFLKNEIKVFLTFVPRSTRFFRLNISSDPFLQLL